MRVLLCLSAAFFPSQALAAAFGEQSIPTLSAYGGVGLLDMRTARFMPDGYLSASVSVKQPDDRIALTFQGLPWAEATFRYSINYAVKLGGYTDEFYDRSFDVKFRLAQEGRYIPEIAFGFQDVIGTGVYSGEYVVASKQFGPLDLTAGLGWGRLGTRGTLPNPFRALGDRFNTRPGISGIAGAPLFGAFFRGQDVGLFGGVEYTTPVNGLKLQLEYSSDAYVLETQNGGRGDYGFPVNVGLRYRALSWLDVGLSYMHGREIGLRVSTQVDLAAENHRVRVDPPIRFRGRDDEVVAALRRREAETRNQTDPSATRFVDLTAQPESTLPAGQNPLAPAAEAAAPELVDPVLAHVTLGVLDEPAAAAIRTGFAFEALNLMGLTRDGNRIRVAVENNRYRRDAEAIARAARVLSVSAPDDIDQFEITVMRFGQPLTTVVLPRSQIDAIARRQGSPAELWYASTFAPADTLDYLSEGMYPRFGRNVYPFFRQGLFDPINPLYVQFGVGATGGIELSRGLWLSGKVMAGLYDNFPEFPRLSDSVLPHVRTDTPQYMDQGRYSIEGLEADYFFKLNPEVYGRVSAGYLEWMFAGVGGELLYRPFGQRWSVGANIWAVRQRDYNQLFGLRKYQTVTGHLSAYYRLPYHDIQISVHAGRYLAGDYGATFEAMRHFSTGVRVGAWFTLTNVSAERFGEGSFDKGIRLVIPFEWFMPTSMQQVYDLTLRPIQRDGGQMLLGGARLPQMTDETDFGTISQHWISVFRQ